MSSTDIVNYNFTATKGDDTQVTFRYLADGSPADLTGSLIYFECNIGALNQLCAMIEPKSGEFTLNFSAASTANLDQVNVKYYVRRWPSGLNGKRTTIFSGTFRLE